MSSAIWQIGFIWVKVALVATNSYLLLLNFLDSCHFHPFSTTYLHAFMKIVRVLCPNWSPDQPVRNVTTDFSLSLLNHVLPQVEHVIDWVRVVRANGEPGDAAHVLSQGFKAGPGSGCAAHFSCWKGLIWRLAKLSSTLNFDFATNVFVFFKSLFYLLFAATYVYRYLLCIYIYFYVVFERMQYLGNEYTCMYTNICVCKCLFIVIVPFFPQHAECVLTCSVFQSV